MESGVKHTTLNYLDIAVKLFRYNLKVIFANRFIYFLLASLIFFIIVTIISLFNNSNPSEEDVYYLLMFPGILLVFYPSAFGIQNDVDARTLEIIFGIPNYRYKVWLIRLILIYIVVVFCLVILSYLSSFALIRISELEMSFQLMFPIFFLGSLAFMFSTIIRSGNGTAAIMVIIGIIFWIAIDFMEESKWYIFLNPFETNPNMSETAWQEITLYNRMYLVVGSIITIVFGLFNLQKREKFV